MPREFVDTSVYSAFLEHLSLVPANTDSNGDSTCKSCGEVPLRFEGSVICKSVDGSAIKDDEINDFRAAVASLRFRILRIPRATSSFGDTMEDKYIIPVMKFIEQYVFKSKFVRIWYELEEVNEDAHEITVYTSRIHSTSSSMRDALVTLLVV
ncbi:hypothetical protein Moror_692, partial [Moniliophthora roreri MCA 2997]